MVLKRCIFAREYSFGLKIIQLILKLNWLSIRFHWNQQRCKRHLSVLRKKNGSLFERVDWIWPDHFISFHRTFNCMQSEQSINLMNCTDRQFWRCARCMHLIFYGIKACTMFEMIHSYRLATINSPNDSRKAMYGQPFLVAFVNGSPFILFLIHIFV